MIEINPLLQEHGDAVLFIYEQGIATGTATFETAIPSWETLDAKYLHHSRLLATNNGEIAGWAMLSAASARECYSGVAEVAIYVHEQHRGKGTGKLLLTALIDESEKHGVWSLLSVIQEENKSSIHIHQLCGFRIIGYRERIAQLHGAWKTTVMMEKRSKIIGVQ